MSDFKKLTKQLLEISDRDRRTGRTTALAKAARETGGTLICHDMEHADQVAKQHGVHTTPLWSCEGNPGPHFVDHFATESLMYRGLREMDILEKKLDIAKTALTYMHEGYEGRFDTPYVSPPATSHAAGAHIVRMALENIKALDHG